MKTNTNLVCLIGCGGREHQIAKTLKKNDDVKLLVIGEYVNPLIDTLADVYCCYDLSNTEYIDRITKEFSIEYVIIGPEKPLELGVADRFLEKNIPVIGPTKQYALIETDKNYCRNIMRKYSMSNYSPKYYFIDEFNINNLENIFNFLGEYVIKECGLCGGKGVKIKGDHFKNDIEGMAICKDILEINKTLLIEEKLIGEEFSLMSFTDGDELKHMPPIKDYKRAYDGDKGPNTGSMGSVSFKNHCLPFLEKHDILKAQYINKQIVKSLKKENDDNIGFKGIIYGSFIKTKAGIKVIEYNARFGDPEAINALEILETDLNSIFTHINNNTLKNIEVNFKRQNTLCKYIVPKGYPANPIKNKLIHIPEEISFDNLICASINKSVNYDMRFVNLLGSRAFALIYSGDNLNSLIEKSNQDASFLDKNVDYRKDIGKISFTYKQCGVSIDAGNNAVQQIKDAVSDTYNERVEHRFGDYSGLLNGNYLADDCILVGSIDGVGTKSSMLSEVMGDKAFYNLGQDIVNHSINDILVKNAKPLFFMDYIASSRILPENICKIVSGMAYSCKAHNCPILGGETAEMPGTYRSGEHDIVGSIVGYVDRNQIIDGKANVKSGSIIIGLPSDSPHTNGYSMIRKIHEYNPFPDDILEWLCQPHKSYFSEVDILNQNNIKIQALCHVTGGGLIENPPRVISQDLKINFDFKIDKRFKIIQDHGNISQYEMYKTFNCGIGMLIFINEIDQDNVLSLLKDSFVCGIVENRNLVLDEPQINFV